MKIIQLFVAPVVILASLFFVSSPAFADTKFSASYNVTYQIQTNGTTIIDQNVDLKNLTANFYATEYSLSIGATKIKNVSASDSTGNLNVTVSAETDTTKIRIVFGQKVVGLNRVLSFRLRYESDDIAVRNGFVWEVTVPKLASPESIDSYNLTLKAPKEIGAVASISPVPKQTGQDAANNTFLFDKEQLIKSGVNASFGDHQVFNFTLKYHLANTRIFPVIETIALPPDTETQTVIYSDLSHNPSEIVVDNDGNYLAKYRLDGNQELDITLSGQVKIWNKVTNPSRFNWSEEQLKKYTVPDKYWESSFPAIIEKAKELKTAKAIYDYVTTTLKYDYERASGSLERFGASVAIAQPEKSVCMEFTDLFIALARAAGIPARELNGFAYTTNAKLKPRSFSATSSETKSDILHAWPEYWNDEKKLWIQIDPTWGSTTGGVDYFNKLDMNHFVFAIKGISSSEPFPAGSYKTDPKTQTGDVDVTLAPAEVEITTTPSLKWDISSNLVGGLPFTGTVVIENNGNTTIFGAKLSIKSQIYALTDADLGPIPPLSRKTITINGRAGDFSLSSDEEATLTLSGLDAKGQAVTAVGTKALHIQPLLQASLPLLAGLVGLILVALGLKFYWPRISLVLARQFPWLLKSPPSES